MPPCTRVAQYIRMSTDHQRYSTENQEAALIAYALTERLDIVREYVDAGKSGLNVSGREGLSRLLADVQTGTVDFKAVLVYDISRWGRFQDADESAYYEHCCKRAGIRVIYVAENFSNDGSPLAAIIKAVKRAMAAEFSRELSTKVFIGQCRLVKLGFHQGGRAGYGLRRQLVSETGEVKGELKRGDRKGLHADRVVLIRGPTSEIRVIRSVFKWYAVDHLSERVIAERLNEKRVPNAEGKTWSAPNVHWVLTNERYLGNSVYNRRSRKLKAEIVWNSPDDWVRATYTLDPIISRERWDAVQRYFSRRRTHYEAEALLDQLRALYEREGRVTMRLINAAPEMPWARVVWNRFGTLARARELAGLPPHVPARPKKPQIGHRS